MKLIDKIKAIRGRYGYPIHLTKEVLNYYDGDIDKATEKLNEIYGAIGDHPDVVVKRNIENFMNEVHSKNLMCKDDNARNAFFVHSNELTSESKCKCCGYTVKMRSVDGSPLKDFQSPLKCPYCGYEMEEVACGENDVVIYHFEKEFRKEMEKW